MIIFNEDRCSFYVSGKNYTYCMYVNSAGFLQHLYYGKKVKPKDCEFLTSEHGAAYAPDIGDVNFDMATDGMPSEIGSFGRGDFRSATVICERGDGAAMSSFRYVSHEITKGAKQLNGMPCVRKADETLSIVLKDEFSDVCAKLNYTVSDSSDILIRNIEIINTGNDTVNIKKAFSFCTNLQDECGRRSAMRLAGTWAGERKPVITPLAEGMLRVESTRGYSSHQMNPFLAILSDNCNEDFGDCFGFNLIYSGNFVLTAEMSSNQSVRIQGGINDYMFSWRLSGGENFITPQVALCYSTEGLGGLSRAYHDFYREFIINPEYVYKHRPIVINNWEATYFDFDNEKLFAIIDEATKLGIDAFVLDDGWFGNRNSDKTGLGDWIVNERKLAGGLKTIIERCKKNGLKFGLWFEPEMVSEDSDLYRAHPDWIIRKAGVTSCKGRNQFVLDFTKKEVINYVFEAVSKVLKENDISYVKWDKNREITEFYSDSLSADRQGEFAHRYTLGFYDLAKRLTGEFPDVLFEGCAGGGGRFDGGALFYFPQIWTSDDTDGYERTKIQWGTSVCYPLSSMSCHASACPNHQTGRTTPFTTRGNIASLGATGYELDLSKLTSEEKEQVRRQIEKYKAVEDLILKGDLYRIADPFNGNYFCEMVVSKDKKKAYLVYEQVHGEPCAHNRIVKLKGLDENKLYRIKELNVMASGAALMEAGIIYRQLKDFESCTFIIEAVG